MNDWLGIRHMYWRVVTWLLNDYHSEIVEVTYMNDYNIVSKGSAKFIEGMSLQWNKSK